MFVRCLKALSICAGIVLVSIASQAEEELHKDLLTHNFYRGGVMYLHENHGLALRELRVLREGDKIQFTLADKKKAKTLELKISDAERSLQSYPFGLPEGEVARDHLQHLQWKQLGFTWDDSGVAIDNVHLFFKSDELLADEKSYGMSFMPPLHRVLLRFDSKNHPAMLDGGLYSEDEVEQGDWDKFLKVLSQNYEILIFNGVGGCEKALTHDEH